MKTKFIIPALAALSLVFTSFVPSANACSVVADYKFATPEEILADGGSIFMGKVLASGSVVVGEVIDVQKGDVPSYVVLRSQGTSCDDKFNFDKDYYFVAVSPKEDVSVINHSSLDKQFAYYYKTQVQAEAAMKALLADKTPDQSEEAPQATYVPAGHTLRPGMKGDDVWKLQDALNRVLPTIAIYPPVYPANADGVYGVQTTNAVKMFQKQAGLAEDGIAGAQTQEALVKALTV